MSCPQSCVSSCYDSTVIYLAWLVCIKNYNEGLEFSGKLQFSLRHRERYEWVERFEEG
jgi:hypothetical protein